MGKCEHCGKRPATRRVLDNSRPFGPAYAEVCGVCRAREAFFDLAAIAVMVAPLALATLLALIWWMW